MKRISYPECQVEVEAWAEHDAFACEDAEVWIEGDLILVSYFDDDGIVVLEGKSDGSGGWKLGARSRPRRATLSAVPNEGGSYTGSIEEGGETGAWKLRLGVPVDED